MAEQGMIGRPGSLPEFENPPLVEVVLAVQFDPMQLKSVDFGPLWDVFSNEFPEVEEHPPLQPQFEMFGSQRSSVGNVQIELLNQPPTPRLWFIDASRNRLIQFQSDRFIYNWRKERGNEIYPRYGAIRERFISELEKLKVFLGSRVSGEFRPNQCEVTYVNHIIADEDESLWANPEKVLRILRGMELHSALPPLEAAFAQWHFALRSDGGGPIGRLHIVAKPEGKVKGRERMSLTLTARGTPLGSTNEGVLAFLDLGREAIVRGFAAATTDTMHARWRRTS